MCLYYGSRVAMTATLEVFSEYLALTSFTDIAPSELPEPGHRPVPDEFVCAYQYERLFHGGGHELSITDIFSLALSNLTGAESEVTSEKDFFATISPRDVLFFVIGIVIAYVLGLIISHHLRMRMSHRLKKDQLDILTGFIRVILIIIAVGISLPGLLDLSVTIIIICIAGVIAIIALSSQKVISNMVAGIALLYESPFATGDYISTGGVEGTVVAVRLFSVRIRTGEGVYVHIPNDQIYSTAVSNVHANVARRFEYRVGIRYQDDTNQAIAIIRQLLEENPYCP